MKLAHLILCHTDAKHIARLARRLSAISDIFIHVDAKVNITEFEEPLKDIPNVFFTKDRFDVGWGSFRAVEATVSLLSAALQKKDYDRLVFLQGADYPIKTDEEILSYYAGVEGKELIRGCLLSEGAKGNKADRPYYLRKQYGYYFYNKRTFFAKLHNHFWQALYNHHITPHMTKGYVQTAGNRYELYWGGATFALTGRGARYVTDFFHAHPAVNAFFKHTFPCDEMYFQTILFGSPLREDILPGAEAPHTDPTAFLPIHYAEYPKLIRIWREEDFPFLTTLPQDKLYCRKVNTEDSSTLLLLLDERNHTALQKQEAEKCSSQG